MMLSLVIMQNSMQKKLQADRTHKYAARDNVYLEFGLYAGILTYHIERAKTFDRVEDQEQKERCQFFERCGLEDVSENF